jgi:hypothetical protein
LFDFPFWAGSLGLLASMIIAQRVINHPVLVVPDETWRAAQLESAQSWLGTTSMLYTLGITCFSDFLFGLRLADLAA